MRRLRLPSDPRLVVGPATADDAAVWRLDNGMALVQTVDFFTPIVDDPYLFGQIAAANSLSDIYAMGAKPLLALNIVAFPLCSLGVDVLAAILQGGADKVAEAGAVVAGGHSVDDPEPKYGLAVTGMAAADRVLANAGARPGDALVLTKPLGTGILATAARAEMFLAGVAAAEASMAALNRAAAEVMAGFSVHACTDITGFGFLGHAREMAAASGVSLENQSQAVPLLPEAAEAAAMGLVPAGAYANREFLQGAVFFAPEVPENLRDLLFDPQTSGGLLLAVDETAAADLVAALRAAGVAAAAIVGRVSGQGKGEISVR